MWSEASEARNPFETGRRNICSLPAVWWRSKIEHWPDKDCIIYSFRFGFFHRVRASCTATALWWISWFIPGRIEVIRSLVGRNKRPYSGLRICTQVARQCKADFSCVVSDGRAVYWPAARAVMGDEDVILATAARPMRNKEAECLPANVIKCFSCNALNHVGKDWRGDGRWKEQRPNRRMYCFCCHNVGHMSRNCSRNIRREDTSMSVSSLK